MFDGGAGTQPRARVYGGARPTVSVHSHEAAHAAVGYLYFYARGTSVQGVLCELLHHRGGAVDYLSGGDLLSY